MSEARESGAGPPRSALPVTSPRFNVQNESLLAAIVQSSDDAIIAKDLDGVIQSWNPAAERLFGYSAEEAIGKPITILSPPEQAAEIPRILDRIRNGERIEHYETRRRAKDGRILAISLTVSPLRDAHGTIVGASKIARDITERKRASESLRIDEEWRRLAVDAGSVGLWDWDIVANQVTWSERLYEFHGLAPGSFGGTVEEFGRLVHPEDAQRVSEALRRTLESDAPYELEFRTIRPSGEVRWLATRARILRNYEGRPVRLLGATLDITAAKRSAEALAASEERMRLAQEAAHIGSWSLDARDPAANYWSPEAYRIAGIDRDWRPEYASWLERVHAEDRDRVHQAIQTAMEKGPGFVVSYRFIGDDGVERWHEARGTIQRAEDGAPLAAHGITVDITDRQRSDAELRRAKQQVEESLNSIRESEERYRFLAEALPQFVWTRNDRGEINYMNRHWMEYTGLPLAEGRSGNWLDLVHPQDRPKLESARARAVVGLGFELELRIRRASDGAYRWHLARGRSIADVSGETRWIGTAVDIDDRKRAEETLRASEARFRQLSNVLPAIVWVSEPDGHASYFNERWYAYTGLTPEQSQGTAWRSALHPEDAVRVLAAWEAARDNETDYAVECRYRSSSGEYNWFMARALPVQDESGRIVQWFGASTDIHEAKRTEAELRRANADLEQFAYSASHDLQEPLRLVAIYSQLLQRKYQGHLDAKGEEYLKFSIQGAKRMEALLAGLLAYTQAVKVSDEQVSPISAGDALDQALANLQGAIAESGAAIEREPMPELRVQPVHLVQLFQNLIGNAIKYRGDQPPVIRITAKREQDLWKISVADNGIGISPQYSEQIFGLFKRLHNAGRYAGTGIGLALCQKIANRYGGHIWVESQGEGQGSTFHVTLPA